MTIPKVIKYADYEFQHSNNSYCLAIFVLEVVTPSEFLQIKQVLHYYVDIWSTKTPIFTSQKIGDVLKNKIETTQQKDLKSVTIKPWISNHSKLKFYRDEEANKRKIFFIDFLKEDILKNFTESEFYKIKKILQDEQMQHKNLLVKKI